MMSNTDEIPKIDLTFICVRSRSCFPQVLKLHFFLGGSLAALIAQDEYLSEEVVREFSIDLMRGLKYIHDSGIVVSDLTPAKV